MPLCILQVAGSFQSGVAFRGYPLCARPTSEEVLFAGDGTVNVGRRDIESLKEKAKGNRRQRMRLCAHKDVEDKLHEMLIVHTKDTYVRPHKHLSKTESFHVIEGSFDVVSFDDEGNILEAVRMGEYSSGKAFFHRGTDQRYHTLLIRSEVAVFHETTNGPFRRSDTLFAPWSPDEKDGAAVKEFMKQVAQDVSSFLKLVGGRDEQRHLPTG